MDKIFLCATDPGGARCLAPLIEAIQRRGLECYLYASERTATFFSGANIHWVKEPMDSVEKAVKVLRDIKPVTVLCGTTGYFDSPDRMLTLAAKQLDIKCMAVLDEWFNFRVRFENEMGELTQMPDLICCPDQAALEAAVADGLERERCRVTGNPSLSLLASEMNQFREEVHTRPSCLGLEDKVVITFISEKFEMDLGSKEGEGGPLGNYLGYTESSVRKDIFSALSEMEISCTVIEKLHPRHDSEPEPFVSEKVRWIVTRDEPLWSLLWHSDLVIGMRSMALLETVILGKQAISYQPNLIGEDVCAAVHLGFIKRTPSKEALKKAISDSLKVQTGLKMKDEQLEFLQKDAVENILSLALG